MIKSTCSKCSAPFEYAAGRGRRRSYCDGCRRLDTRRRQAPEREPRPCATCGAQMASPNGNRRYCSDGCRDSRNWENRSRVPCDTCGGPTGWGAGVKERATCLSCRRQSPGYRIKDQRKRGMMQHWTCAECGVACSRPATKGQRPKYCETCRRVRRNPLISLSHRERLVLYERDGWTCGLCADSVDRTLIGSLSPWRPSLDHVVPRSLGGDDEPANLRLAHFWCNSVRGAGVNDDLF